MGFDAYCLIADWAPAVATCREYRGVDFFWQAPEPPTDTASPLPFAIQRDYWGGWSFVRAGDYYAELRGHLPDRWRVPADAALTSLYHEVGEGCPGPPNDLVDDAGGELIEYPHYSMRPATVRELVQRMRQVPWDEMERIAETVSVKRYSRHDVDNFEEFRCIVANVEDWLREAARLGRGMIMLIGY